MNRNDNKKSSSKTEKKHEIQTRNFQKHKNALKKFSEIIPSSPDLPTVATDGGLFGWFDHKVTGSELNYLTDKVQNLFIATNNQLLYVINEFGQIYQTFEALDKDYIQGIIAGIEAAKVASNQATKASKKAYEVAREAKKNTIDIQSLIKSQKGIIDKLVEFKKRIENIPHLDNVSSMWNDIVSYKSKINSISDQLKQYEENIHAQALIINKIVHFKDEFEAIPHIRDLNIIWDNLQGLKEQVLSVCNTITDNEKSTNNRFAMQKQQITKQNDELVLLVEKNKADLSEKLTGVEESQAEQNKEFNVHIETIQNGIRTNDEMTNKRFLELNTLLLKKIKIAYLAAGTFGLITVTHIILAVLGIV